MGRHLRIEEKHKEEEEVVYAPFVMAIGLILTTVLVTVATPWAILGLLVVLAAVVMWVRESIQYGPELIPVHPEYHHEGDRWHHPSNYWWGSLVYSIIFASGFFAMVRVAQAHDVFDPRAGELALRYWIGHVATAVAALGLVGALFAARSSRRGEHVGWALALLALAPLAMLALMVTQAVYIVQDPNVEDSAPRLAALLWVHVYESIWLGVAAAFLGLIAMRAFMGHVPHNKWNISSGAILFGAVAMAQFVLLWAFLYLGLLEIEADLIG